MYFKRVEMQGFKSFADPASIEFQDGITCIVGPNGSGKSNISDALKWVLGEQSPRALRGGKMEEVIFAGTAARKPKGMAEVTLVMDNSESGLPIDYSEVALRRRMYRSGESEYFINNSRCRLRDIRELIMDTGIGVDGYSIISQGEIMEIVGGRPESRRELFEAAAGIVKYRARKAESERKLGAASVNLERVEDIIGEVESRLGGLREDSEKAREYLLLRDKYRELEINITLKNIEVIKEKNEYIAEELAEISGRLDRLRERRAALDGEIGAERVKNEALEQEGNEIRDRLMASAREISEIRGRARLGEEKKLTLEKDKKRLSEEIAALEVKIKKEEENAASLAEKRTRAAAELVRLNDELAEKLERAGGFAGALNAKTRKIDGMKDSLYDFQRERASKESEAAGAAGFGETLERRRKQILEEKDSAGRAGAEIADKLKAAAGRGESLEEALASLEEKKNEAEAGYLEYKKRAEALGKEHESARMLFERLLARKKTIEEMESNYEGYSFGVRSVMRAGIPGLHGVVADLMEAPA
ncbi:MAG: AAA family ATPase, partial [Clostridiales Family XIII bacterium]|nr:AAA family ATPase [Clostridiales Family XIII bacterium]